MISSPSPAANPLWRKLSKSLDRGLAGLDYNLDHHFACYLQFGL